MLNTTDCLRLQANNRYTEVAVWTRPVGLINVASIIFLIHLAYY